MPSRAIPRRPLVLLAVLSCVVLVAVALAPAHAAARPNLKVTQTRVLSVTAKPGGMLRVSDTTRNAARRKARASVTAFWLSADAKRGAGDVLIGTRAVRALAARRSAAATITLAVPAGARSGSYRVVVCADHRRTVHESREGDNCRASKSFRVVAPTPTKPTPTKPTPTKPTPTKPTPTQKPTSEPTATEEPTATGEPTPTKPTPTDDPGPHPTGDPVTQLTTARAAPDGLADLPVDGAVVTYVKPAVGAEPAGFFVQAAAAGPAILVQVDPTTLTPTPAAGDRVAFRITGLATLHGLRVVTAVGEFTRTDTGVDLTALRQDLSTTDLAAGGAEHESELMTLTGTVTGDATDDGTGYALAPIATNGTPAGLRLRVRTVVAAGLEAGCQVTVERGVLWRASGEAQPTAYDGDDLTVTGCPDPVPTARAMLTEISPISSSAQDLVELRVVASGTLSGLTLVEQGGASPDTLATLPDVLVETGDLVVIHLGGSGVSGIAPASETTAPDEFPSASYAANYDTAWDVLGGAGLANGNRVLRLVGPDGTQDAVPLAGAGRTDARFPAALQALQAEGLWNPTSCNGTPCTYSSTPTAWDVSVMSPLGGGTTPSGDSFQRVSRVDADRAEDWAVQPQTFGHPNA